MARHRTAGPDSQVARTKYPRLASTYDLRMTTGRALHRRAVERLELTRGQTVLDLGCGTGLAFPYIEERIGRQGRLIGIELSPEMLAEARRRVCKHGWENVELIEAAVEEAVLPGPSDAALFVLTHDLMRSRAALRKVIDALGSDGRIVAAGSKWAPRWLAPLNLYVWLKARRYVTTFEGFDHPWSLLADLIPDLRVETALAGAVYIASGTVGDR